MVSTDSEEKKENIKITQNYVSDKYFINYVRDWEESWFKAIPPSVLTEKELKEEENEIEASQNEYAKTKQTES